MNKITYLASEYPAISHTFIFREIEALREAGYEISTASINLSKNQEKMTEKEKRDCHRTLYIKDSSPGRILKYVSKAFFYHPLLFLTVMLRSIRLFRKRTGHGFLGLAYFIEAMILTFWMKEQGSTHIHVHFANPAASVALIASFYGTVNYSMSVHGPDVFYNVEQNLLGEKILHAVKVRCISHFCSSQCKRLVPSESWNKFEIVRCGVDPEKFAPRKVPDNSIPIILCLGRLVPAKGQHILVEALEQLKKNNIDFQMIFVGDGEDRKSLEKRVDQSGLGQKVNFIGAVGQDEVHRYYDKADIFVLPSFAEGVPVVLMEAMAKEIPVISSVIMGIPELIEHGKSGYLVFPSDVLSLAESIKDFIANPEISYKMGVEGRKSIIKDYNLKKNGPIMVDFFSFI